MELPAVCPLCGAINKKRLLEVQNTQLELYSKLVDRLYAIELERNAHWKALEKLIIIHTIHERSGIQEYTNRINEDGTRRKHGINTKNLSSRKKKKSDETL